LPTPAPTPKSRRSSGGACSSDCEAQVDVVPMAWNRKRPRTLIKAVKDNDISMMEDLLRDGANMEVRGMWDNTPLLAACLAGHGAVALKLINLRADINAVNENNATPLHYAVVEGLFAVVEALIATARLQDGASKFVNCGAANIYGRHLDTYSRRTPLCAAAENGLQEIAEVLLDARADIEDGEDGRTPLWLACRQSRQGSVRLLLQRGASTAAKDYQRVSVLEVTTSTGNDELALLLLSRGVKDVNDSAGSPLRDAVRLKKRTLVETLLTQGASVHPRGFFGNMMPLHVACDIFDEYLISLLIKHRADPSLRDASGRTCFDILHKRGLPDSLITQLLQPVHGEASDGSTGSTSAIPMPVAPDQRDLEK